jgi:16S rRNA (uracil1498-N3)-methyltransferase
LTTAIANTHRFFVAPAVLEQEPVVIDDAALTHQIGRVLRLHAGDRVLLLDGQGLAYEVCLTAITRQQVTGQIEQCVQASGEPTTHVVLYVPLIRAERFEWVLQKGTELGVQQFVPVAYERSLTSEQANERKLTRWRKIVREAAEQSCRGRIPDIVEPMPFAVACQQTTSYSLTLLLWEGRNIPNREREAAEKNTTTQTPALRQALRAWMAATDTAARPDIALAIYSGPEGGITSKELTTATEHGIMPVSLGPRVLRAETAPIVAATAIFYELE